MTRTDPPVAPPALAAETWPEEGLCGNPMETLSCLLKTVERLNTAEELDTGLARVAEGLQQEIAFDTFAVLLLDDLGQELRFHYALGCPPDVVEHWRFGLGQGIVGRVAASGEAILAEDVGRTAAYIRVVDEVRSEVAVPLTSQNRTIGVLDVCSFQKGFFTPAHLRLLQLVAGHLAGAIESGRLYANLRRQTRVLSALHEASRELTSILDSEALLRRVGEIVHRHVNYNTFSVLVWSQEEQLLRSIFAVGYEGAASRKCGLRLGQGLCGTAAALRQTLRVPNVDLDPRYETCGQRVPTRSELVVPLLFKERLVGVLDLESYHYDAFSRDDEQFLATLASYIAIALENARLYERLREDEQKLALDLETARGIQKYLLPKTTPWVPGLQIAVAYSPARHLGGDIYDVLSYGEQRTAVAIGDVAGKGTGAALYGSLVIGMLRGFAGENCDPPASVLGYLNEELRQLAIHRRFVAMTYAVYDHAGRTLSVANAGLPYPYRVHDGRVEEIVIQGVPVGGLGAPVYHQEELRLEDGEVIVFASDGIEELLNGEGVAFGGDRVAGVLRDLASSSAREIADGLLDATHRFLGEGREASDDRTVVVLKVTDG